MKLGKLFVRAGLLLVLLFTLTACPGEGAEEEGGDEARTEESGGEQNENENETNEENDD